VAARPLAAYKPITREAVALVPLPVAPQQYFTTLEDVVGRIPLLDIDAGAPVTARYFKEGNALARVIPAGFQAVSVEINDVIAVGGFVRPGDIVDLLVYLRGGPGVSEPQARVLLKQVRVLAYEERIVDRPQGLTEEEKAGGSSTQVRRVRTAVLAVPEAEATRVMLGANLGELRLALRSQDPTGEEKQVAETTENGVPLSPQALAARESRKVPDAAITASQLSRVQPPPAEEKKDKPAPAPTVEVIRGGERERVTTRN
jgi:pilus assembly protein CpaB